MQMNIFSHKANDIDIILHKYQSSSEATQRLYLVPVR